VGPRSDAARGERGECLSPKTLAAEDELWHDLALALGGRSVAEWQDAISEEERSAWLTYIEKNGPINPLYRLNAHFAQLTASMFNAAFAASGSKKSGGGQFEAKDFLLAWGKKEEPPATVQDAFALFRALSRGKKNG
jgi:hypothetical protein